MIDLNVLQKRVLLNKQKKGFPTHKIDLDVSFIKKELEELLAADTDLNRADEIADCMLFLLGIASYYNLDMEYHLLQKMFKIEQRKITKISDTEFLKEEGK